jgi:FKBP12-rapamycin complex-associated protein
MPQTRIILQSLANLAPYLREYSLHTIPIVISVAEDKIVIPDVRREALCTVMHIISDVREMHVFAGRIIHPLLRIIDSDKPALQACAFIALSTFVCKLGTGYIPFVVTAKRKLLSIAPKDATQKSSQFIEYEYLVDRLLNQLPLPTDPSDISLNFFKSDVRAKLRADNAKSTPMPMSINMEALEAAWTLTGKITMSDLVEWMRRLSIELIRQSPSPIIRPCAVLAKVHQPLAVELFNAAFVSIWSTCFSQNSNAILIDNVPLILNIEMALQSSQIPDNIRQALLNLAEFLEMQDTPLPIDMKLLANQSQSANMFAKCLRYREIEFASVNITPTKECIEALISVNKQLGLRDSANGVLEVVRSKYSDSIPIQPRWLEKLHCWEEARLLYLTQSQTLKHTVKPDIAYQSPEWLSNELGMLRCLRALGEHAQLNEKVTSLFHHMRQPEVMAASDPEESHETLVEIQRLGAHSAWMLGRWDDMDTFLGDGIAKNASGVLATRKHRHSTDLENNITFYHTIMAIQKQKYTKALNLIEETRTELGASLSSLMNESYSRAYRAIVSMQLLTELEEVVKFKDYAAKTIASCTTSAPVVNPSLGLVVTVPKEVADELNAKKATLVKTWRERFRCAPREVDVYREILVSNIFAKFTFDANFTHPLLNFSMYKAF